MKTNSQKIATSLKHSHVESETLARLAMLLGNLSRNDINPMCIDCKADLSARLDFEPFIQRATLHNVTDNYRAHRPEPIECLHVAICAQCIAQYAEIDLYAFFGEVV